MKKVMSALLGLVFLLTGLFPFGALVSNCFGYTFRLTNIFAFSVIIAVLSVLTVIFSIISKDKSISKGTRLLLYILTPLSFVNTVFYIFESGRLSVAVCVLVSFVCMSLLMIISVKGTAGKIAALVLCALMTAFVIYFSFIMLTFGIIGKNTVVRTIDSPDGKLYAQVVDSDQGALGGATVVKVYEKREIDAFIFKLEDKPQRVYVGEWGEFDNIKIHWKDDNYLVVNSVEYEIK